MRAIQCSLAPFTIVCGCVKRSLKKSASVSRDGKMNGAAFDDPAIKRIHLGRESHCDEIRHDVEGN